METTNVELGTGAIEMIAAMAKDAAMPPGRIDILPAEGGLSGVVVPKTHDFKDLTKEIDERLERLAPGPKRLVANEVAETFDGYISLTKRHAGKNSVIQALLQPSPTMVTFVDYHVASTGDGPEARRMLHSVSYAFPFSERLKAWTQAGSSYLSKREFLAFVQERLGDIVSPHEVRAEPGSVTRREFEAVLRARGKSIEEREAADLEALFGSAEMLIKGVQETKAISAIEQEDIESGFGDIVFTYKKVDKTDGKDRMREFYLVSIEVFEGEAPRVLPARLKMTAVDGAVVLKMEVIGLRDVIKDSFEKAVKEAAEKTGLEVHRVKLAGKSP